MDIPRFISSPVDGHFWLFLVLSIINEAGTQVWASGFGSLRNTSE